MGKNRIHVVAAVIANEGELLCVQRGPNKFDYIAYKWEFPGGKLEEGESEQDALYREIKEELKVEIEVREKLITVDHEYPDFCLIMHAYACFSSHRDFILTEHVALEWRAYDKLSDLDWAAADVPIVKYMQNKTQIVV